MEVALWLSLWLGLALCSSGWAAGSDPGPTRLVQVSPQSLEDFNNRPKRSGSGSGSILSLLGSSSGGGSSDNGGGSKGGGLGSGGILSLLGGGSSSSSSGGGGSSDIGSSGGGGTTGSGGYGYGATGGGGYPASSGPSTGSDSYGGGGYDAGSGSSGGGGYETGSGGSGSPSGGSGSGLLGGKGFLGSLLGSSSSNSHGSGSSGTQVIGKGPTYSNYIGGPGPIPTTHGQRSFDFASFRSSLMGVLMQAVRAITGGVIALKGQLVRVKGRLVSAKGNIISASGEALSQFGRNVAANALRPTTKAPPPRPVYGVPLTVPMAVPRPVYGPPISFTRPQYGPPPQQPVVNIYSNAFSDVHSFRPPPPPPPRPVMGPPPPPSHQYQPYSGYVESYGPPAPPSGLDNSFLPHLSVPGTSYGVPETAFQSENLLKGFSNSDRSRYSVPSQPNPLEGVQAGLLLLKPAQSQQQQVQQPGAQNFQQQLSEHTSSHFDSLQPSSVGSESTGYGDRINTRSTSNSVASSNDRTFSFLFGSKKPAPLKPHPVTRALPPQVVAAASAQLAAKLDLTQRRNAIAVSGPHGKFIMYA